MGSAVRRTFAAALAAAAAGEASAAGGKRPPRVLEDAVDFGGGSPDAPGHGRPMQEQGSISPVEELSEVPSWSDFFRDYVRRNRPVVLRGHAASQRAYQLWTDDYLIKGWGAREVSVEVNKTEERGGPSVQMPLKRFIKEMYREERNEQYYAIIDFDNDARAKADFDLSSPLRCKEVVPQSLTLWMSSGGTKSVLHEDDAENVLMLLAGRKSVMLVHQDQARNIYAHVAEMHGTSPVHQDAVDLSAFPRFANVSWLHGELGPGDTLYIPHTYWHQVVSSGRNLAVNLWWGHREDWRWWDPKNPREYDARRFGTKGFTSFDKLKSRGPESVRCTPLPEGEDLSKVPFADEGSWAKYIQKKRREAKKRKEL